MPGPIALHLEVLPAVADLVPDPLQAVSNWQGWLQRWVAQQIGRLPDACSYELSLQLANDTAVRDLNARYRQVDAATDVLAFAALEATMPLPSDLLALEPLYLGDIAISVDTAARQARDRDYPLGDELVWLAAHGFLHLLGWDHPNRDRLQGMLHVQEQLLRASEHQPPEWQHELSAYEGL